VLETYWSPLSFPHDKELYYQGKFLADLRTMRKVVKEARGYDIVHVHAGVHWKRFDIVAISQILRKPIVVHYHGSETRLGYGLAYRHLWKHTIVGRPDLLSAHPRAVFIRNPIIGVEKVPLPTGKLRVLHTFHNPDTKGSAIIRECLEKLVDDGVEMEFSILEKVDHERVMEEMARSHVVIDQLIDSKTTGLPSIIGVVALEAMAMGRAVVSSFDPAYQRFYPGCPVLVVDPNGGGLMKAIREVVADRSILESRAMAGPKYVESNHSPLSSAKAVLNVYGTAMPKFVEGS